MTYSITFSVKTHSYQLVFRNQLNLIYGDSSAGKSTICKYIVRKEYSELQCSGHVVVVRSLNDIKYAKTNDLLFIDSDDIVPEDIHSWISAVLAIRNNSICVVWFGRCYLNMLPFAVQNTYVLKTNNRHTMNVHVLLDNQYQRYAPFDTMLIEDAKSGYTFFKDIFDNVKSTNGNSNLVTAVKHNTLTVFDSVGFGSYILEFLKAVDKHNAGYVGYTSFEGFILEALFDISELPIAINIEKELERMLTERKGSYSKSIGCASTACQCCDCNCKQSAKSVLQKSKYATLLQYYREPSKLSQYLSKFDDSESELKRLQELANANGCTVEEIIEDLA